MIVTQPNEDLASFTNGKNLRKNSKCLCSHTHGKHFGRRDNRFFFSVLWVGFFVHVINRYQQIREVQEYKEKFVVSENTFEFMGTCKLAV